VQDETTSGAQEAAEHDMEEEEDEVELGDESDEDVSMAPIC
jgi:hypothetical protein